DLAQRARRSLRGIGILTLRLGPEERTKALGNLEQRHVVPFDRGAAGGPEHARELGRVERSPPFPAHGPVTVPARAVVPLQSLPDAPRAGEARRPHQLIPPLRGRCSGHARRRLSSCSILESTTSASALRWSRQAIVSVESKVPFSKTLFAGAPPPQR